VLPGVGPSPLSATCSHTSPNNRPPGEVKLPRSMANVEIYVVFDDGTARYYLLKVQRRGMDVYSFPPRLGMHVSAHASGEIHFTDEEGSGNGDEIAIALVMGQAGRVIDRGIIGTPLQPEGPAIRICTAICPATDLSAEGFREYKHNRENVFVISANQLPPGTELVTIGVWGVPARNEGMFWWNNHDVREDQVYKSPGEPSIWIFAQPY